MHNRLDATLSAAELQQINDAFDLIKSKLAFAYALMPDERRRGDWNLSPKALLLSKEALMVVRAKPSDPQHVDKDTFARDIALIDQLHLLG